MLRLSLNRESRDRTLRILCIGAHADDIEIGCGGTILSFLAQGTPLEVHWFVFGATGDRANEARRSADYFLEGTKASSIEIRNFRNSFFPYFGAQIKNEFEELKRRLSPDVVLTHYRNDLHQDHRLLSELTWNTFRDHLILEYEIPKYDGDLGSPNLFVPLEEKICERKVELLLDNFVTQAGKHWFSRDTFLGLMRLRGVEAHSPTKYAEAFYARKILVGNVRSSEVLDR
jgi:Uncharacterized proteins, LmbE homologs